MQGRRAESTSAGRQTRHRSGQKEDASSTGRRWVELEIQGADSQAFVGLVCKVFWPLDDDWYKGSITGYTELTRKHSVKYDDGEAEDLTVADERIKFFVSSEERKCLNLKFGISNLDKKGYDELLALAVSFHDYQGRCALLLGCLQHCLLLADVVCKFSVVEVNCSLNNIHEVRMCISPANIAHDEIHLQTVSDPIL